MKDFDTTTYASKSSTSYGVTSFSSAPAKRTILGSMAMISNQGNKRDPTPWFWSKAEYTYENGGSSPGYTVSGFKPYIAQSFGPQSMEICVPDPSVAPTRYQGAVLDRCMTKIYDQIRGNSNFVVDLAESSATLKMFKSTLSLKKFIAEFFKELIIPKKLKGIHANQRRLDYVTGKWLEKRYGWDPLVYSIYDAMETLGGKHVLNGVYPVTARSSAGGSVRTVTGGTTYSNPRIEVFTKTSVRYHVECRFHLNPSARIYDWTSLNPVGIAWELFPLSFVADWILNVSEQLSLWENYFLFNSKFKNGYQTVTYLQEAMKSRKGIDFVPWAYNLNGTLLDSTSGRGSRYVSTESKTVLKSFNRGTFTSLPFPSGIRLKVSFGAKRQLDAAALIHQLVGKKFR